MKLSQTITSKTVRTTINFTKKWIDNLPALDPKSLSKEKSYTDAQVTGLKLLVNKQGKKFFYLRYSFNGRKRGIKVGEYGAINLVEARKLANKYRGLVDHGVDPQDERQKIRQVPTFGEFAEQDYVPYARANKKSFKSDESKLKHHLLPQFQHRAMNIIKTVEIQRYCDRIKGSHCPATANRHISLIHRMFVLAVQWDIIDKNPATGIRKFQENNERHRYLSQAELSRLFKAMKTEGNRVAVSAIKFLLFTGARRQEALDAQWKHVDLVKCQWLIPETKGGKSRHIILNDLAVELLEQQNKAPGNPYVFPGRVTGKPLNNPRKVFLRILNKAGIEDFRIHDLRHCFASICINNGASLYEVQHLLGHANSKTTTRYAHLADESLRKVTVNVAQQLALLV
jgi:integrase